MKKINLFLSLSVFFLNTLAQQNPTNNNPSAPGQNGRNDKAFWSRAGNSGIGANGGCMGLGGFNPTPG